MKNIDTKVESLDSLKDENENLKLLCSKLKNDCKEFDLKEFEYQTEIEQLKMEIQQKDS
jgi:hypothetical protein